MPLLKICDHQVAIYSLNHVLALFPPWLHILLPHPKCGTLYLLQSNPRHLLTLSNPTLKLTSSCWLTLELLSTPLICHCITAYNIWRVINDEFYYYYYYWKGIRSWKGIRG